MRSWPFTIAAAAVLLGTIFGGWLHGRMVTRWGAEDLLNVAAKRLQQPIAEQHGNWRLIDETPFPSDVVQILQCSAHINHSYLHQQTGDVVHVSVIVGPPGPTSVHKPEICFAGQDVAIIKDREPLTVVDRAQAQHSLWQLLMERRKEVGAPFRVLYAWGTGDSWTATGNPRFAHANEPYLYKIQLAGPLGSPSDEFDPCEDFLSWFLPEIQVRLIPTNQDSAVSIHSKS